MIRSSRSFQALAVAAAAGLALSACGTTEEDGNGGDAGGDECGNYALAFMGALTGDAGALGQNMVGGVKMAVEEYNEENSDCKVEVKEFDSQGDPAQAPKLATQIVNDDSIIGLVGPGFSGESLATGKTFNEAGLPVISPSATNVTITEQGWTTWHRVIGNDAAQGAADARYLTETVGATKVFVVDDAQDYSVGLAGVVKEGLGDALVDDDQIQVKQTDMSAVVSKIKNSGADAVFYAGYYTEAGLLAKQLRQAGFKGTFMSGDGSQDPAFVEVAGASAANGAILSAPAAPAPADFSADFEEVNGSPAGLYSTQSYDAAKIFLEALADGKTSGEDINTFIGEYDGEGVSGPVSFDDKGDIEASVIYAYKVANGEMDLENPEAIE